MAINAGHAPALLIGSNLSKAADRNLAQIIQMILF
jgi:hypothetical protein